MTNNYHPTNFNAPHAKSSKFHRVQQHIKTEVEVEHNISPTVAPFGKRGRFNNRSETRSGKRKDTMILKHVSKMRDIPSTKVYVCNNWSSQEISPPKEKVVMDNLESYTIYDSTNSQSLVVCDDLDGSFIVSKVSRRHAMEMGGDTYWGSVRKLMRKVLASKPSVARGSKNGGTFNQYCCFGYRKDPRKSGVLGEYAFKPGVHNANHITTSISELVSKMEKAALPLVKQFKEYKYFQAMKELLNLPSAAADSIGNATQFSVGVGSS